MKLPLRLSFVLFSILLSCSVGCTHNPGIYHGQGLTQAALLPSSSARQPTGEKLDGSFYLGVVCVNHKGRNTVQAPGGSIRSVESRQLEVLCEEALKQSLVEGQFLLGSGQQASARPLVLYVDITPTMDIAFTPTKSIAAVNVSYTWFAASASELPAIQASLRAKRPGASPSFITSPAAGGLRSLHQVSHESTAEVRVSEERVGAIRLEKTYLKAIQTNLEMFLAGWPKTSAAIHAAARE